MHAMPASWPACCPPRARTRVVLALGDVAGGRRSDQRVSSAVLEAIQANRNRIGQLVVISPAGGGTGVFGRAGGAGAPRLTPLEQAVVDSRLPYLLVRTATLVDDRSSGEAGLVAAAGLGGVPSSLAVSRAKVAKAVVAAISQAAGSAIIELGASDEVPDQPVEVVLGSVLAEAEALAPAAAPAEEEEDEEEAPAPTLFGFGTLKKKGAPAAEEGEEEETPKKAPAFAFSLGGTKKKAVEKVEEEPPAPSQKPAASLFSFGTKKKVEEDAPAQKPAASLFSFGTKKKVVEKEEDAPAKKPAGLFSFGSRKQSVQTGEGGAAKQQRGGTAKQRVEKPAAQRAPARRAAPTVVKEKPAPPPKAARLAPPPKAAKPAPAAAAKAEAPPPKKGGFLQALGISQETIYVDE